MRLCLFTAMLSRLQTCARAELDPMVPYLDGLDSKWNIRSASSVDHLKNNKELGVTSEDECTIEEMFRARLQRLQKERHRNSQRLSEGQQECQRQIKRTKLGKLDRQLVARSVPPDDREIVYSHQP